MMSPLSLIISERALTLATRAVLSIVLLQAPVLLAKAGQTKRASASTQNVKIHIYESTEAPGDILQEQPPISFGVERAPQLTIFVNDALRYQTIDGFGASLTDSSAWLLANKLTDAQRKDLFRQLFDPVQGIGLNLLRQPMGASDFAIDRYTYDDVPTGESDPGLKKFSIEKDQRYIIPLLREVLAVNPNLRLLASPWSPPAWMKTSQSLLQGTLLPSAYKPLADYFVKFVQAYEQARVPIFAVTMQNEPLNIPLDYPGMGMNSTEQANFLRDDLGPAFRAARLKTKIFAFDHNWDLIHYPIEVLGDTKAAAFVSGIAIHCYGGSAAAQTELHNRFPHLDIWLTECSGGDWQKGKILEQQVRLIIEATRNWSHSVILWNLALDQNNQPFLGGCRNCRGVVTVKTDVAPAEIIPSVDYTALAHAGKFVHPGAQRIDSNTFGQDSLEDVAFRNPDGSLVLLVLNTSNKPVIFNIGWSGKFAVCPIKGNAVATYTWPGKKSR
jgi:glucosylceramidase